MLPLQTHREAVSSSAPRACLTARPPHVCFRRTITARGALWNCYFVRPNLASARVAYSNMLAAHQHTRRTPAPRRQQTIEHP
jgi:hypothetical protein